MARTLNPDAAARRRALFAGLLLAAGGNAIAAQSEYPSRPIRFMVGAAPGGGTDFMARLVGQRLTEAWGQPVVVDNRTGATGLIAMEVVAKAAPDGYTMVVFNVGHMMSAHLARKVAFDPVADFTPVSLMANAASILAVHPGVPVKTLKEFVAFARARPGKLSYASGGVGGVQHLGTELFKREAGVDLVHVPYKGSGPGSLALVSGQVEVFFTNALALIALSRSGKVTALAVTGRQRMAAAPEIPTFAEAGFPAVEVSLWQGMFAPAGTPARIVDRLSATIATIVRSPELVRQLEAQGAEPAGTTAAEFGSYIKQERERWLKVVRDAKITAQ